MQDYEIQRSKAWHEFRRNHIGSSDAPVIMGVSPWKSPLELYHEKIAPNRAEIAPNRAMQRGVELEPLALAKFEAETGYLMTPRVMTDFFTPWRSASLDGYEIEGKCAVEIKCPGKADHDLALKGQVPEKYFPQLQHIMEVCKLSEMYYMSYVSDSDFTIFTVKKDYDYTDKLLQAESEFWQRIQDRNPPEPTDRDSTEISSEEWASLSNQYAGVCALEKDYKSKLESIESIKDEIKDKLVSLSNNKSAYGSGIKLSKVTRRGHFDYAAIQNAVGFDLEPFRKQSTEYWKISFQGEE